MPLRDDPVIAGFGVKVAPSYQEIPEREVASMRALAAAIQRKVWAGSPWRPFVTLGLLPEDVTRYQLGRGGSPTGVDPTVNLTGPTGLIAGYWTRLDHAPTTPPGDVTWTATNPVTPKELLTMTTLTNENYSVLVGFEALDESGVPEISERTVDPIIANELAGAIIRTENLAFATGAASTADPFHGLSSMSGFSTQAATANLIDDLLDAIGTLRAAKRPPNVSFAPTNHVKKLRKLKGSTGGAYLIEPDAPLVVDGVPIVPLDGLANSAGSVAYVGDFRKIVVLFRYLPNGMLLMLAKSDYGSNFAVDKTSVRAIERLDQNVIPGSEPSFVKITGVDAS
ncbi:MAG: phage major capsid protein [Chloroflexota bacterium]|nr:phage major capsid protein [Chloroflexota bacterium]